MQHKRERGGTSAVLDAPQNQSSIYDPQSQQPVSGSSDQAIYQQPDTQPTPPDQSADAPASPAQQAATIKNLMLDPDAVLGTRFTGPVLSGDPAISPMAGICMLHKRFKIVAGYGNFSLPVVFPPSSILTRYFVQIQQSFNGTLAKFQIGTTQNGSDIANVDVTVAPTQQDNPITSILGSTWTVYVGMAGGASTQGKATILIFYSVPAQALVG